MLNSLYYYYLILLIPGLCRNAYPVQQLFAGFNYHRNVEVESCVICPSLNSLVSVFDYEVKLDFNERV